MIRAISRWATVAMLGVAATALVDLAIAFLPLADLWAAHHPGPESAALATTIRIGAWTALAVTGVVTAVAAGGWAARARSNLAAFGVSSRRITHGSVGPLPGLRRRMTVLTWLLRATLLSGCAAMLVAWLAGLDNAAEIADVRRQAAAGLRVDDALAAHLFGRQLVLRLPAAALFVAAAVVALLLIARVTSAQYGRVARLRDWAGSGAAMPPVPQTIPGDGGTIRS
ncbi:hypothetical protein [Dactylosporangium sp. NPDC048998]|uniref:hypothetical protein n=1 Tax=Dactylosporangium sp. NPDC048998 TaxID=3363976 RepID=UPI003715E21D